MRKSMQRVLLLLLSVLLLSACAKNDTPPATGGAVAAETTGAAQTASGELVILFTNDVHGAIRRNDEPGQLGYGAVAAYRDQLERSGSNVILIDAGDALQGDMTVNLSKGAYCVDLMNAAGYDFAVPGDHDFDFGFDRFLELAEENAEFTYLSCNFVTGGNGEPVFPSYELVEYDGISVAFVGICTPAPYRDSQEDRQYFFTGEESGEALYDCVQKAIDSAKREGADYVVAVGHLGTEPEDTPWTSVEVIANTTGLNVFLDGHSHSLIEQEMISDKDGNNVLLTSGGENLVHLGEVRMDLATGAVTSQLVSGLTEDSTEVLNCLDDVDERYEELLSQVIAHSDVALVIRDPDNAAVKLTAGQETNLGDLCADAYRSAMGADVGFVTADMLCGELPAGDVTYGDVLAVFPYEKEVCLAEVTGRQIMDALEFAYMEAGEGNSGRFLQVSGLTCEIDTSIPTAVVLDDAGNFQKVDGERRVKNIKINGENLLPSKRYTVASQSMLLRDGENGFSMFSDSAVTQTAAAADYEILLDFLQNKMGGTLPPEQYGEPGGQGRITIS